MGTAVTVLVTLGVTLRLPVVSCLVARFPAPPAPDVRLLRNKGPLIDEARLLVDGV